MARRQPGEEASDHGSAIEGLQPEQPGWGHTGLSVGACLAGHCKAKVLGEWTRAGEPCGLQAGRWEERRRD